MIYHHYLAPSFHYFLAVNQTSTARIQKLEAVATRKMKKWLNLPENATQTKSNQTLFMKVYFRRKKKKKGVPVSSRRS